MNDSRRYDVIVVGAGCAGLCAALAAREQGASVLILESAPMQERGGNSRYGTGEMRFAFDGVEDLKELIDLSDVEVANSDFGRYGEAEYREDLVGFRPDGTDPDIAEMVVARSRETLVWMRRQGVQFEPMYLRQAVKQNGRFRFFGGLAVEAWGGGPGLIEALFGIAEERGVEVRYDARAERLLAEEAGVTGVVTTLHGQTVELRAHAVVLASGGFEANPEWRTRHLGEGWTDVKVRGSRFNTGAGIGMALVAGAAPWGDFSACHAVPWDREAPELGDLTIGENFQKLSYPYGIMVNARGERFVDEGADFRNFTFAQLGRAILDQPGRFAWQIFDKRSAAMLRDEYRIRRIAKVTASTIEELAEKMETVHRERFVETVQDYNGAVRRHVPFNPAILDGRSTIGLPVPKSNWALEIETPPFEAYCTVAGITCTFGGLRIDTAARVLDGNADAIPGLYAAGEIVGGLFGARYPGGAGLAASAVIGRTAGTSAVRRLTIMAAA